MTSSREVFVEAVSAAELLTALRLKRVAVPPLGHGKRTSAVETWTIRRFLATLSCGDVFDYPIRVERGERPDFVIRSHLGTVGVEVTEAVPRGLAHVRDIQRREGIDSPRAYRRFKPGEAITATEAQQIARSRDRNFRLPDEAAIMESWIDGMTWVIGNKQRRFTYPRHDRNTLLIDDQWPAHDLAGHPSAFRAGLLRIVEGSPVLQR